MPSTFVVDDGLRLAFYTWGDPGGSRPVVLQHGFAAHARLNWEGAGIVAALVAAGRHVVALDARGHGQSDRPHESERYGEDRMSRDLSALLDHLGLGEVDLVGYSMGAVISLITATRDCRVRRLVVGGVGEGVVVCGGVDTRSLDSRALAVALRAQDPRAITDPAVAGFRAFAEATGADRLALAAHADVVHASPIPLERIGVPTLLVAGDRDPLAVRPQVLADAVPGARLVVVPGDHLQVVRTPEYLAALLDFLG